MKPLMVLSLMFSTSVFALGANVKPTTLKPADAAKLEQRVNKLLPKTASQAYFFVYGRLVTLEPTKAANEYCLRFEKSRYVISKNDSDWELWNTSTKDKSSATANDIKYILQVLAIGAGEERAPARRASIRGLLDPNSLELWLTRRYPTKGVSYNLKRERNEITIPLF